MEPFRSELGEVLDQTVQDMIDVDLAARHLRWNVVGWGATSLRLALQELSDVARGAGEDVAERSLMLGRAVDGLSATPDRALALAPIPAGALRDATTIDLVDAILEAVTSRLYAAFEVAASDPLTYDLLVGIAGRVERAAWIIRAQDHR